jgi:gluconolactonase
MVDVGWWMLENLEGRRIGGKFDLALGARFPTIPAMKPYSLVPADTLTNRRQFFSGLAAGAAGLTLGTRGLLAQKQATAGSQKAVARDWTGATPTRYPDPDIISLDPAFNKYKLGNTPIQRIYHSPKMLWAEGPAWNGVGRYLLWSDIPNDLQLRWLEEDGHSSVFRKPSGNSNGNTFDYQGRQISCQHGTRKVVRYEHSGAVTVLAEKFEDKRFNAPNDAIVHPEDGAIWFTDPGYGSMMNYEGNKGPLELKEAVYRIDAVSGAITKVTDDVIKPNGLCFSPDYKKLYVSDTGTPAEGDHRKIRVWDLAENATRLAKGRDFASMGIDLGDQVLSGGADGIRADVDGNIWASAGWVGDGYDGVHIFAPEDGRRIGQILLPEICSNVCFGGKKRNRLFMTASTSVYAVYVEARGAHIS